MAETLGQAVLELTTDLRKFAKDLADAKVQAEQIGADFQRIGSSLSSLGVGLSAALTVPIAAISASVIKLGIDAVESENLFEVSFGAMADQARTWSVALSEAVGLNEFELRQQSATIFAMVENMGLGEDAAFDMATGITALAGDMASFFNLKPEEAFAKLQAGITGEAEPLKRLGILVDENTIKHAALEAGLIEVGEEMDQTTKVTARWLAIQEQTVKVQGDLARTLESPANQLRAMRAEVEELGIKLGTALLPALQSLIAFGQDLLPLLQGLVDKFVALSPEQQKWVIGIFAAFAALGPFLIVIGQVVSAIGTLAPLVATLAPLFAGVGTAAGALVTVLTGPVGLIAVIGTLLVLALKEYQEEMQRTIDEQVRFAETVGSIQQAILTIARQGSEVTIAQLREMQAALTEADAQLASTREEIALLEEGMRERGTEAAVEFQKRLEELRETEALLEEETAKLREAGEKLTVKMEDAGEATGGAGDSASTATGQFSGLSGMLDNVAAAAADAAAEIVDLSDVIVSGFGDGLDAATDFSTGLVESFEEGSTAAGAFEDAFDSFTSSTETGFFVVIESSRQFADETQAALTETAETADEEMSKFGEMLVGVGDKFGETRTAANAWAATLGQAFGMIGQFLGESGSQWEAFFRQLEAGFQALAAGAEEGLAQIAGAFAGGVAQLLGAEDQTAAGVSNLVSGLGLVAIGAATGNWFAVVIGAVQAIIGIFQLFEDGVSRNVQNIQKKLDELGVTISEELFAKVEALGKALGDGQTALRQFLGEVIASSTIATIEQLGEFIEEFALILDFDLAEGLITSEMAAEAMADALDDLLDNFVEAGGGVEEFRAIMDVLLDVVADFEAGLLTAADAALVFEQNFAQIVAVAVSLGDEGLAMLNELVVAIQTAGLEIGAIADQIRSTVDEAIQVLAERNQFLLDQTAALVAGIEQMFAAGFIGPRQLEFAAQGVVAAFNAMLTSGIPLSQIMETLASAIGLIGDQAASVGASLPPAFADLGEILDVLAQGPVQNMISGLEGMGAAAEAVGNMGLLTAKQFDTFGDSIDRAFKKLQQAGLEGPEALAALAPQLQQLLDLQQQYGFEVDAATQALLDQALAQGVIQDQQLTTEDILITGFDRMLEALNALIVALGGVPLVFEQWGISASAAADATVGAAESTAAAAEDAADATGEAVEQLTADVSDSYEELLDETAAAFGEHAAGLEETVLQATTAAVEDFAALESQAIDSLISIAEGAETVAEQIAESFDGIPITFDIEEIVVGGGGGPGGGEPLEAQHGTGGFLDFGAGSPAILHGREQVLTAAEGIGVAQMVARAIAIASRGPEDSPLVALTRANVELASQARRDRKTLIASTDQVRKAVLAAPAKVFQQEIPGTVC